MKIQSLVAPLLVIVLLVAIITNPSEKKYNHWFRDQVGQEKGLLFGMQEEGVLLGGTNGPVLKKVTTERNFALFTLYRTPLKNKDEEIIALGIFNHFIWIKGRE